MMMNEDRKIAKVLWKILSLTKLIAIMLFWQKTSGEEVSYTINDEVPAGHLIGFVPSQQNQLFSDNNIFSFNEDDIFTNFDTIPHASYTNGNIFVRKNRTEFIAMSFRHSQYVAVDRKNGEIKSLRKIDREELCKSRLKCVIEFFVQVKESKVKRMVKVGCLAKISNN